MFRAQISCHSFIQRSESLVMLSDAGLVGSVDSLCTVRGCVQTGSHMRSTVWRVLWHRVTEGVTGAEATPSVELWVQVLAGIYNLSVGAWRISRNHLGESGSPTRWKNSEKFCVALEQVQGCGRVTVQGERGGWRSTQGRRAGALLGMRRKIRAAPDLRTQIQLGVKSRP